MNIYIYIYAVFIHCLESFRPQEDKTAIRTARVPPRSVLRFPFRNVSDTQMITRETDCTSVTPPPVHWSKQMQFQLDVISLHLG